MNHPSDDPDDLVRKKIDLNHITKMTLQMHVPDSITVGPRTSTIPRLNNGDDRIPVRMEVPERLRPGGNGSMIMLNEADFFNNTTDIPQLSTSTYEQISLPSTLHPTDIATTSDDDERSLVNNLDSWAMEPFTTIDDKQILNKLQLLQNRVYYIERGLARRENRDRLFYTCLLGYFLIQTILSVRRSIFN